MSKRSIIGIVLGLTLGTAILAYFPARLSHGEPIRVGVLHSFSGTMALSEKPVAEATLLAVEEINQAGGLLGRPVVAVVADGRSDEAAFASEAERLILDEKVSVIFGCWTSASRKAVKEVVERHGLMLVYPVQYEGVEQSPCIFYTGASPNQQITPGVTWCYTNLGKRFFLVGSDYIFPRVANTIIKDHLAVLGGTVVGEEYLPLGSDDMGGIVAKIAESRPDVILNTINGDSNLHFFRALRAATVTPTMSFSITEYELQVLDPKDMAGHYLAWNYFQGIDSEANRAFLAHFRARYGENRIVGDPAEAGYFGVRLWAQAVTDAGSTLAPSVRRTMKHQSLDAPEGMVSVDGPSQNTWKIVRVGKVHPSGEIEVVWTSERPVRPVPYPGYRSREAWDRLVNDLYEGWGRQWAKSGR